MKSKVEDAQYYFRVQNDRIVYIMHYFTSHLKNWWINLRKWTVKSRLVKIEFEKWGLDGNLEQYWIMEQLPDFLRFTSERRMIYEKYKIHVRVYSSSTSNTSNRPLLFLGTRAIHSIFFIVTSFLYRHLGWEGIRRKTCSYSKWSFHNKEFRIIKNKQNQLDH